MKRNTVLCLLVVAVAVCSWPQPTKATGITVVNRATGGGTASQTTATVTMTHAQHNGLVVLIDSLYGTSVSGVTDGVSDAFSICGPTFDDQSGVYNHLEVWTTSDSAGGTSDTITVTFASSVSYRAIVVYEVSGQETSGMCDTHGTGHSTGTSLTTQSNVVINAPTDIIFTIGAGLGQPISNGTEDSFNTFGLGSGSPYYFDAYKTVTASHSPSFTQSNSNAWALYSVSIMEAGGAHTITVVGSPVRGGTGGTGSSTTVTTDGQTHTAGNGLVALVMNYGDGTYVTGVANDASDPWKQCGTALNDATLPLHAEIWYVSNSAGHSGDVVTATFSGSTAFRTVTVYEVHGQKTTDMCGNSSAAYGTGTGISSGTVLVNTAQQLVFAVGAGLGPGISHGTWGVSNFQLDGTHYYYFTEYLSVTGSSAAVATQTMSAAWVSLAAGFVPQ